MPKLSLNRGLLLPACLFLALAVAGCEEDVTAVVGIDRPFTAYGVLNPEADTQKVRVFPITTLLEKDRSERIDAVVSSVDQATGARTAWRDSLVRYADGSVGHLFWAPFRAAYGHTYRVEVAPTDGGGASSYAGVVVPPRIEAVVEPATGLAPQISIPVQINGEAPRLIQVTADYYVRYDSLGFPVTTISIPYTSRMVKTAGGWRVQLDLDDDYRAVELDLRARNLYRQRYGIALLTITLRAMVVDAAWNPPNGVFDANVLVEPGVMTNVENGFGFIGSGYYFSKTWLPDRAAIRAVGFRTL